MNRSLNYCIFPDLYDWSKPEEKFRYAQQSIPFKRGLQKQNSKTGDLVSCNEEEIAVFRYHDRVYAIKEKCPHLGIRNIKDHDRM